MRDKDMCSVRYRVSNRICNLDSTSQLVAHTIAQFKKASMEKNVLKVSFHFNSDICLYAWDIFLIKIFYVFKQIKNIRHFFYLFCVCILLVGTEKDRHCYFLLQFSSPEFTIALLKENQFLVGVSRYQGSLLHTKCSSQQPL